MISLNRNSFITDDVSQLTNMTQEPLRSGLVNSEKCNVYNDQIKRLGTVTDIYEPKFLEIFEIYALNIGSVDCNAHLLTLSLEHLSSFCCWARESIDRQLQISELLNHNVDLRPEVRNGIAKIMIYSISSFLSFKLKNTDFFMVLQDTDNGLGIVNKTSLKIYNDPYKYFDFIKACLTGLIDAGFVPENERNNQPKKFKKIEQNKDEYAAFIKLKDYLINLIQSGQKSLLRSKIEQILDVWQIGHKNVRSKRFVVALSLLKDTKAVTRDLILQSFKKSYSIGNGNDESQKSDTNISVKSGIMSNYIPSGLNLSGYDETYLCSSDNKSALLSLATVSSNALAGEKYNDYHNSNFDNSKPSCDTVVECSRKRMIHDFIIESVNEPIKFSKGSDNFSYMTETHHEVNGIESLAAVGQSISHPSVVSEQDIGENEHFPITSNDSSTSSSASLFHSNQNMNEYQSSAIHEYFPFMKMLQTSDKSWEMNEMRVFDLPSQLSHTESSIFLIDESKLTASELSTGILTVEATKHHHDACVVLKRNSSLQSELQSRKAIVAMWTTHEYPQLVSLLQNWQINCSSSTSLQSYWKQSSYLSNPLSSNEVYDDNRYTSIPSGHAGHGILVYEEVQRFGIVIRQNSRLNITEDYWRILYPNDLHHTTSTFQNFLQFIFPQLKLNAISPSATSESSSPLSPMKIVVKYFPHNEAHPFTRPPAMEDLKSYQTLGTLDEDAYDVIGRFVPLISFHDVYFDFVE
eukprot:gene7798-10593_t